MVIIKKYWSKKKIVFLAFVIVICGIIPIGINESYQNGEGYMTLWGAKDMLQFYGSVLGAIATVIGVYFTLDYTRYQKKRDYIQRITPILYSNSRLVTNPDIFSKCKGETYFVYINEDFNISLSKDTPRILDEAIVYFNKADDTKLSRDEKIKYLISANKFINNFCMVEYELKNVGEGNAINVDMKINDKIFIPGFEISKGDKIYFKFIINFKRLEAGKEKEVSILYNYTNTCLEPQYYQKERFNFYKKKDSISYRQNIQDFISKQSKR